MKNRFSEIAGLEPSYPVGPQVAVYKVDNPRLAQQMLLGNGLGGRFQEDLAAFKAAPEGKLPSFLAMYHNIFAPLEPTLNVIAIVHFRLRADKRSPGWALFIAYYEQDSEIATKFANAVFDRTFAELEKDDMEVYLAKTK